MLGKRDKDEKWETDAWKEVERILKEGRLNSRLQTFMERFEREKTSPPEEWQDVFNTFFENYQPLPAVSLLSKPDRSGRSIKMNSERRQNEAVGSPGVPP